MSQKKHPAFSDLSMQVADMQTIQNAKLVLTSRAYANLPPEIRVHLKQSMDLLDKSVAEIWKLTNV